MKTQITCFFFTLILFSCRTAPGSVDAISGASVAGIDMPSIADGIEPAKQGKRILVVYFSQGNATKRVAEDLAIILGADTERIIEKQKRTGFFGFLGAGADSSTGKSSAIETPEYDLSAFDAVIICTPMWAWSLSPPVRTWILLMKDKLPVCAFVVVSAGTESGKVVAMMETESGRKAIASAGFMDKDFTAENREMYIAKLGALAAAFR